MKILFTATVLLSFLVPAHADDLTDITLEQADAMKKEFSQMPRLQLCAVLSKGIPGIIDSYRKRGIAKELALYSSDSAALPNTMKVMEPYMQGLYDSAALVYSTMNRVPNITRDELISQATDSYMTKCLMVGPEKVAR